MPYLTCKLISLLLILICVCNFQRKTVRLCICWRPTPRSPWARERGRSTTCLEPSICIRILRSKNASKSRCTRSPPTTSWHPCPTHRRPTRTWKRRKSEDCVWLFILVHFNNLKTWSMQLTMSFFRTLFTALWTNASWSSCRRPTSFIARRALNRCLILANTNSIGLY